MSAKVATMTDADDLLAAAQKNEVIRVRQILDRDPFLLRTRTPNGTLVLTAAYYGSGDVLKLLLERTPEDALNTYEAAATGSARRLKTILGQSPVRINEPNEEGFTPLALAAHFGHLDAVKVILGNGADVNRRSSSRFQNTAVDAAVAGGAPLAVVRALLSAGADPNVRSEENFTTLHKAAHHGDLEIVRLLLDHGADPNAVRDGGHTAADDAREEGHAAVEELLRARAKQA